MTTMVSIDYRTRPRSSEMKLDASQFFTESMPVLIAERGADAATGAEKLAVPPLTLDVAGDQWTLLVDGSRTSLEVGDRADGVLVRLAPEAFSDLMQDIASTFGLHLAGRVDVVRGTTDQFVAWEPILRCLLDGRRVFEPGDVTFQSPEGGPLDISRSFSLDDDPAEMGWFLAQAGFLHVQRVFTDGEMTEVSRELDEAMARARPEDGASWWARTRDGQDYPSRILGFNQCSPSLRSLLRTERFASLGRLTDDRFVQRDPDVGDSAEGLLKKVGVSEGISDVSWHKDCAIGGHSRGCCGLTVGLSVTGAGPENGELGVIAGSHRANVAPVGPIESGLPRLPLPTQTGDVTIHCSCTLHMSRPPLSAERRVVYTGFGLAPLNGETVESLSPEESRRQRAQTSDHVRRNQVENAHGSRMANFEL
jgi:hypothetical protein